MICTCLGDISSSSCLTLLPVPAWLNSLFPAHAPLYISHKYHIISVGLFALQFPWRRFFNWFSHKPPALFSSTAAVRSRVINIHCVREGTEKAADVFLPKSFDPCGQFYTPLSVPFRLSLPSVPPVFSPSWLWFWWQSLHNISADEKRPGLLYF